jgi:intein-encoded DNA endonuclease-like protein
MAGSLAWPPKKDDLERMYLVEKLSAAKIAAVYGLKYKNPKVAESTVLYQLKRNGISRREATEHVRKIRPEMVDEWARRYETGESLKQIAGGAVSPVTVWLHLRKRGLRLRDKVEAQIKATTKHARKPFDESQFQVAYLLGFSRGDLNVSTHGRAVRVKTATTHPLMVEHIRNLFGPYGHVSLSPRLSGLAGYEWNIQVDLDNSFLFLFEHRKVLPRWVFAGRFFRYFLAGFFDAEGSVWFNETTVHGFMISLTNSDRKLLEDIHDSMKRAGMASNLGYDKSNRTWKITMWNRDRVGRFLSYVPLKHPEKLAKAKLALKFDASTTPEQRRDLERDWALLLGEIKEGRDAYVNQAKTMLESKEKGAPDGA